MNHELKILPEYYKAIVDKVKTFEVRKNDRNFKVGDQLILREFIPDEKNDGKYTGSGCAASINYILEGGQFGIEKGYCVMSITVTATRKKY